MKRRAARVDANQPRVVAELRDFGISVHITSQLGDGFPDLVCGFMGINGLYELKDPEKFVSQQQLSKDEKQFHNDWKGDVQVVFTSTEIIHDLLRKANQLAVKSGREVTAYNLKDPTRIRNAEHQKDYRTRDECEQSPGEPRR